ncbi:MAG: SMP-30/gluconolactonase/LRE family protein [Deltaproteobacteria bacterium]|nr:SMP-30/gluconolactonase/LRE family protein [Deltaproteobacteria bacterium]
MLYLLACTAVEAPEPPLPSPAEEPGAPVEPADPPVPTVPPVDTGSAASTTIACDDLPSTGTFVANLDYIPTFEDFTFSADGYLWGVSLYEGALTRVPYGGPSELLRPGVSGYARGTRFLPDGDLVSVDYPNNSLLRIDVTTYTSTVLTGGLTSPNAVAIDESGDIFLTQVTGRILRIDPATGLSTPLALSAVSNDGLSFSPDYRTLYLNSDAGGDYQSLGLDAAGEVTSPLAPFAELPGPADGMVVDACGNAYVTQFEPPSIVRVRPDGIVEPFILLPDDVLAVAVNFGTGVGGWEAEHLFISDWNGEFLEYDAGVTGKWEPHL